MATTAIQLPFAPRADGWAFCWPLPWYLTCLSATPEAMEQALIRRPATPARTPALIDDASLAYLTVTREDADPQRPFRLGATAYGPSGEELARDLVAHIDTWGAARLAVPRLTITPSDTGDAPGHTINKPESRITLTY
ncbi:hypothetical protein [Streptomyces olivaceus]|uniref:hypothetical protein n=1 Tax=Streptomyces olivaceus TaxID=47716 RepID=UPI001CCA8230|nr:hypothetical protein [Streptomyces olivaceus]MBZ6226509.1 hypothetical protein [Streptomyces olivaceus]